MSTTPSPPPPPRKQGFGLSRRALLLIAAAFGIGLLLFLLLWLGQRNDDEFFRAGTAAPTDRQGQVFEPLPMPDAVGSNDATPDVDPPQAARPGQAPSSSGDIIEPPEPAPLPPPVAQAPGEQAPAASGATTSARPVHSPPPRYPARAMRRGESGTVLVQVEVDETGRPRSVDVVQSSRSRELDREAQRTVERWRFSPATRGGRPVASKVLVPIEFTR